MNVNGVTQPVVYIPTQAIAPSVPNDHPISLPTPDRNADPTPGGTPFVEPDAVEPHGRPAHAGAPLAAARVEPAVDRSATVHAVSATPEPAVLPTPKASGVFDAYA